MPGIIRRKLSVSNINKTLNQLTDEVNQIMPKIWFFVLGMYTFNTDEGKRIQKQFIAISNKTNKLNLLCITEEQIECITSILQQINELGRIIVNTRIINKNVMEQNTCPIGNHPMILGDLISILPCGHITCEKCFVTIKDDKCIVCNEDYILFFGIPKPDGIRIDNIKNLDEETKEEYANAFDKTIYSARTKMVTKDNMICTSAGPRKSASSPNEVDEKIEDNMVCTSVGPRKSASSPNEVDEKIEENIKELSLDEQVIK
jgi:hypothetical protein